MDRSQQSQHFDNLCTGLEQPPPGETRAALLARLKQERPDLYAPPEVGALMVELLGIPEGATVLDPAARAGTMYLDLYQKLALTLGGADPVGAQLARRLLPGTEIDERGLTQVPHEERFDYVLGVVPIGRSLFDEARAFDHAQASGAICSEVAWLELAVRCVKPGGGIAFVITTETLRAMLTPTRRWWLASRAREVARVYLPKGTFGSENPGCLVVFEKRPVSRNVTSFRYVLPWFSVRDRLQSAWADHLKRHPEIRLPQYAATLGSRSLPVAPLRAALKADA